LGQQTRIFAAQNPLKQGGGRKGLPQSFLNRFTKVYLKKLNTQDLLHVVQRKYNKVFEQIGGLFLNQFPATQPDAVSIFKFMQTRNFQTIPALVFDFEDRLVSFSEKLETGITNFEFGYKGGPFEANLRDILRWCDLICHPDTGFNVENYREACSPQKSFMEFLLVVFEKMKLVYVERMRTDVDRAYILDQFSEIFSCNALFLEEKSENISFYFNDNEVFIGDVVITNNSQNEEGQDTNLSMKLRTQNTAPLILSNQLNVLKHLTECVKLEKPVILCGPSDSGKTKIIDLLCTLSNQLCNIDTIDDSVTGSFQQVSRWREFRFQISLIYYKFCFLDRTSIKLTFQLPTG
jgi:midasin